MSKSKRAPALLEVMQQQQAKDPADTGPASKWWKAKEGDSSAPTPPSDPPSNEPEPGAESEATVVPEVQAADPPPPEPAARTTPVSIDPPPRSTVEPFRGEIDDETPAIVSLDAGRVIISLNPVSTVIVMGGIVLAVFAAYVFGLWAGRPATAEPAGPVDAEVDPLKEAARRPANPGVLDVGTPKARRPTTADPRIDPPAPALRAPEKRPAASTADPRKPGLNYLVLMDFRKSKRATAKEATAAQQFLRRHNVQAVLDTYSWGWRLWDASTGYTPAELKTKAAEIEARKVLLKRLGKAYFEEGGRHLFEPYEMRYNPVQQ